MRYSQAASSGGLQGHGVGATFGAGSGYAPPPPPGSSSRRPPPPPPPRPRKEGDWDCSSCGALNFASKSQCHRCSAPPPLPETGGGEGVDSDDTGVYTAGGVTYLDGKRHVEKLRRGVEAEVWVEALESWVDCVVVGVQELAVAHTSIVRRTFTCSYFPPGATTTTVASGGGSGGASYVPRSMAGHYGPSSSTASVRGGASVGATGGATAEKASQEAAAPTTITGMAADQFRLIALNEQGDWQENSAAKDEARAAKLEKKKQKKEQELRDGLDEEDGRGTPPPPDPDTG